MLGQIDKEFNWNLNWTSDTGGIISSTQPSPNPVYVFFPDLIHTLIYWHESCLEFSHDFNTTATITKINKVQEINNAAKMNWAILNYIFSSKSVKIMLTCYWITKELVYEKNNMTIFVIFVKYLHSFCVKAPINFDQ